MIKISKQNNSLIVEGIDNVFYPNNGDNSYPLNSLIVVTDNSDMATFRSVATNDVLFSGLIKDITINGEVVTKDNIIQKFDAVSNSSTGGAVDAYTKEEADNKFASKDELTNVQTVANDADTKVDALTPRVEGVETAMNDKQDLLVSGTNIKTINNQSILGEGNLEISGDVDLTNYYTKPEADGKFATVTGFNEQAADISALETDMLTKQPTLVSGTNIKTINGESVLGEGNIEVAKKTDIPSTDNLATKDELTAVETIANNADAKADAATSRIESVETAMGNKQDTLVSGTNIKTVNSQSILGEGNIEVSGVSEEQAQEIAKIPTLETEIAQKANVSDIPTVQTGGEGTNKNYIYSSPFNTNYAVYSRFTFKPNEKGIEMEADCWGSNHNRSFLFQIPLVTTSKNGVMSAADKTKLDSIPETIPSQSEIDGIAANVSALQTAMDGKQPTLVSGTNIKTINNKSILGEGNLEIIGGDVDLTNYYTKTETDTKLDTKQNTLVSGTNIKTINGESVLGEGNIEITGGVSEEQAQEIAKIPTLETEIAQKANVSDIPTVQTGEEGTNKNYIYSTLLDSNYSVYSRFTFEPNEQGIQMRSEYWGGNSASLFQIPLVTTSENGVMSAADKTKLDSIPETIPSQSEIDGIAANVSALETDMVNKQPTLVSGINIKTINSQSILGDGNLEVTIPDATTATSGAMSAADKTKLDSISNEWTGTQAEYDALATKDNNTIYYVTE